MSKSIFYVGPSWSLAVTPVGNATSVLPTPHPSPRHAPPPPASVAAVATVEVGA
jgi:hypothetical protein